MHRSDKYLVAEQSGLSVFFSAVLIAFFLGSVFKAYVSPIKVRERMASAAKQVHKDVRIEFREAYVSLNNGWWPRFSVIVKDVKMMAVKDCWMSPQLTMSEIELPISVMALLQQKSPLHSLHVKDVKVTFRTDWKDCAEPVLEASKEKEASLIHPLTAEAVKEISQSSSVKPSLATSGLNIKDSTLKDIRIENLSVSHQTWWEGQAVDFADIRLNVAQENPLKLILKAKTHLLKNPLIGDYLSHANLHVEYKNQPEPEAIFNLFGHWREGHYSLAANYNILDQKMTVESEVKHIPVNEILDILKKLRFDLKDTDFKQTWTSFRARTEASLKKASWNTRIHSASIEGDWGDITTDQIHIQRLQPLEYEPFIVRVNSMKVDAFVQMMKWPNPPTYLGQLGTLEGRIRWVSDQEFYFNGDHRDLQFLFSNQGQKEVLNVDKIQTSLKKIKDNTIIQWSRFEVAGQPVEAKAELQLKENQLALQAQLQDWIMPESLQKIFRGRISPIDSELSLQIQNGKWIKISGLLQSDQVNIQSVQMQKPNWSLEGQKDRLQLRFRAQEVSLALDSVAFPLLNPIQDFLDMKGRGLKLQQLKGVFDLNSEQQLTVRNFTALGDRKSRWSLDGGWTEAGELYGRAQVRIPNKPLQRWQIIGPRNNPSLKEESL